MGYVKKYAPHSISSKIELLKSENLFVLNNA